jgi:hypothetical protein
MTPEKKLDFLLRKFKKLEQISREEKMEMTSKIMEDQTKDNSIQLYAMFINKLIDDEMIKPTISDGDYIITYKGYFFQGYESEANAIQEAINNERLDAERIVRNDDALVALNGRIAFWTKGAVIVASLVLLWSILSHFLSSDKGEAIVQQYGVFF